MQVPSSAGDGKAAGNIPGSHIVKSFSTLTSHFLYITIITKASRIANFIGANKIKPAGTMAGDHGGFCGVVTLLFVRKPVTKTGRCS
jgi:hypothetical protein